MLCLSFSVDDAELKEPWDLKNGGREVPVSITNLDEYCALYSDFSTAGCFLHPARQNPCMAPP